MTPYDKWTKQAMGELEELGYSLHDDIEGITEDGRVQFKGAFYLSEELVTGWEKSEHYRRD